MADVLLIWEFGGGMGHLHRLVSLGLALERLGHRITLACREAEPASRYCARHAPRFATLSAPPLLLRTPIREPANYAEILVQFGIDQIDITRDMLQAWRRLFESVRPALVVLDYAPLALLALQGDPARRVLYGTGFACPPNREPLPVIRSWQSHYPDRLLMNEQCVLECFNGVLVEAGQPPLAYLAELFTRVDASLLATFSELDHYPDREGGEYCGHWTIEAGQSPVWPPGGRARALAYLRPFRNLSRLVAALEHRGISTLLYLSGADDRATASLQSALTRVTREPVAMRAALRGADLAILHAGHGSTAESLLAGTPILALPDYAEQYLTADRIARQGFGLHARLDDVRSMETAIDEILATTEFMLTARGFAALHADRQPEREVDAIAKRIEAFLQEHS